MCSADMRLIGGGSSDSRGRYRVTHLFSVRFVLAESSDKRCGISRDRVLRAASFRLWDGTTENRTAGGSLATVAASERLRLC